ncbi:hypothetical protein V8F20_010953 [Naviculisporaceae sp. PSN 640]
MKLQWASNLSSRVVVSVLAGLVLLSNVPPAFGQDTCVSRSQPNPIAQQYPDVPTGTLNATLAILPISLEAARKIIPSKWKILTKPYRALLPNLPADKYPVFLQFALDHDIQVAAFNFSFPDFNKAAFSFPFLDLLNDGYTSFTWTPSQLISSSNLAAIAGAEMYGQKVYPANFDPQCDPYRFLPGPHKRDTYSKGSSVAVNGSNPNTFVEIQFAPLPNPNKTPYPLSFYKNITNQPSFGDGVTCNQQIRFFNTSISQSPFSPKFVKGSISAHLPPMGRIKKGKGLDYFGLKLDTAFIEFNELDCRSLQGYDGFPGM